MSFAEAIKGAQAELLSIKGGYERATRAVKLAQVFANEALGTVALAPYGYRASTLHRALPSAAGPPCVRPLSAVHVVRDVQYGAGARNNMDIYLPPRGNSKAAYPVALFCHGGVWAAGAKWHYAPMAATLAELGVLSVVMQYTLYPQAMVRDQVDEVDAALTWTMDNIHGWGGDRDRVSFFGHSAGAQLCTTALLHRAQRAAQRVRAASMQGGDGGSGCVAGRRGDARMPACLVAACGVFDIAKHYEYELLRHVAELSTMRRAIGGFGAFADMSPSLVLQRALSRSQQRRKPGDPASGSFYRAFRFAGEAVTVKAGLERVRGGAPVSLTAHYVEPTPSDHFYDFTLEAARQLPPTVLLTSTNDSTVPWHESVEMYLALLDCGLPARLLLYDRVGHGDFVIGWPSPPPRAGGQPDAQRTALLEGLLPPYASDLLQVLRDPRNPHVTGAPASNGKRAIKPDVDARSLAMTASPLQ